MASIYQYSCPACGYGAQVSGGSDRGMVRYTVTATCLTCQELTDVAVPPPTAAESLKGFLLMVVLGLAWTGTLCLVAMLCERAGTAAGFNMNGDLGTGLTTTVSIIAATAVWLAGFNFSRRIPIRTNLLVTCPKSERHRCTVWKGQCPRCGAGMKRGACVMHWD